MYFSALFQMEPLKICICIEFRSFTTIYVIFQHFHGNEKLISAEFLKTLVNGQMF